MRVTGAYEGYDMQIVARDTSADFQAFAGEVPNGRLTRLGPDDVLSVTTSQRTLVRTNADGSYRFTLNDAELPGSVTIGLSRPDGQVSAPNTTFTLERTVQLLQPVPDSTVPYLGTLTLDWAVLDEDRNTILVPGAFRASAWETCRGDHSSGSTYALGIPSSSGRAPGFGPPPHPGGSFRGEAGLVSRPAAALLHGDRRDVRRVR